LNKNVSEFILKHENDAASSLGSSAIKPFTSSFRDISRRAKTTSKYGSRASARRMEYNLMKNPKVKGMRETALKDRAYGNAHISTLQNYIQRNTLNFESL